MSTSSNAVDNVSVLASAIFKRVDANGDGKLNGAEFQSFLENLLGKVGNGTPGLGSEAGAVAPRAAAAEARTYQPMMGFDYAKLNDPSHTTPKYVFARATQNVNLAWDRVVTLRRPPGHRRLRETKRLPECRGHRQGLRSISATVTATSTSSPARARGGGGRRIRN